MSFTHPRRTSKNTSSNPAGLPSIKTAMSLQKGATFHSPSTPTESTNTFTPPSLPRRSQTTLEEVCVDDHVRRIALTLGEIDLGLSAPESASSSSSSSMKTFRDESSPVPRGVLEHSVVADNSSSIMNRRTLRPRRARRGSNNHHESDSGLGSSIKTTSEKMAAVSGQAGVGASAITRSITSNNSTPHLRRLSPRASTRIHERILRPLIAEKEFKDLHPILLDCPRRIQQKEIICLRDLEKTLLQVAEERAKSAALFFKFSMTSIRLLQATVQHLHEREQVRPADRAYTNGYFIDLVDQVRQAAIQMAATREKQRKGEEIDDSDAESSDEIKLHGGLTVNGKPAELIRVKKNGKAFSVSTKEPVDEHEAKDGVAFNPMKRSASEQEEDNEVIMRSMARRKKIESEAEALARRCHEPGCEHRTFPRQCDLTKHQKTHLRPFKCSEKGCQYHTKGFPTEKECERHHSNVHSANPKLWYCHYRESEKCTHTSKRESNLKQHMEKQHGWNYQRSKSNGKNKVATSVQAPSTASPASATHSTPSSEYYDITTPSNDNASIASGLPEVVNTDLDFLADYTSEDMKLFNPDEYFPQLDNDVEFYGSSGYPSAESGFEDTFSPLENELELADPYVFGSTDINSFLPSTTNPDLNFDDYELSGPSIYDINVARIPTPNYDEMDIFGKNLDFQATNTTYNNNTLAATTANPMLYTPASMVEDAFCNTDMDCGTNDFLLFDSSNSLPASNYNAFASNTQQNQPLFGEVSQMQNMNAWTSQAQVQATRDFFLFEGDSEMKY